MGLGSLCYEFPTPQKDLVIAGCNIPLSLFLNAQQRNGSLPVPSLTTLLGIVVPMWGRGSDMTKIALVGEEEVGSRSQDVVQMPLFLPHAPL